MEINEMHADAIYEEMREERAGINKITGVERPAPMPPMSPFGSELDEKEKHDSDAEEFKNESKHKSFDALSDAGMSMRDFLWNL